MPSWTCSCRTPAPGRTLARTLRSSTCSPSRSVTPASPLTSRQRGRRCAMQLQYGAAPGVACLCQPDLGGCPPRSPAEYTSLTPPPPTMRTVVVSDRSRDRFFRTHRRIRRITMVHRRLLALAPIALMATAMAFGAAQTEAAMGGGVAVTPPGTLPIVEEKITLRVGAIPHPTVIDLGHQLRHAVDGGADQHPRGVGRVPGQGCEGEDQPAPCQRQRPARGVPGREGAVSGAAHAVRSTGIVPAARRLLGRAGLLHHGVL